MQIVDFFVSPAYADTAAAAPQGGNPMSLFIMFGVFIAFMYFAVWRPQRKRAREQSSMLGSLAKGDEVVTAGGILGRINKINEQYITLALNDTQEMMVQKSSIVNVLPKGTMKSIE